jgi:hypothetical protein
MQMQTPFVLVFLAALAMGDGSQTLTTSHRKINWGYGCGGNCAVNYSGQSETTLREKSPGVLIEDRGSLIQRTNDPGGSMSNTTNWKYTFRGAATGGEDKREYDLQTKKSKCARTMETMNSDKATTKKEIACAVPPKNWKLLCERKNVQVKGEPRPAWVCSPAEHLDNFGTEFPWVFGVEGSITTVVSGEPRATTTYEATPPSGQHD